MERPEGGRARRASRTGICLGAEDTEVGLGGGDANTRYPSAPAQLVGQGLCWLLLCPECRVLGMVI